MRFLMLMQIFATLILSVYSNPRPGYYCNNWCNQNIGSGCCDYGYYGGYNPGFPNTNVITTKTYCPVFNCSLSTTITSEECTNDDDCKRKETCCEHPCVGGKKICTEHVNTNPIVIGCAATTNCYKWDEDNKVPVLCNDDNGCKRSETCCYNPCKGRKVCQITVKGSTGTNIWDTGVISCPNPGYCY